MARTKMMPIATDETKELPVSTELNKQQPEASELNKEAPKKTNPENTIVLEGEEIEIKPTKIKYQRNKMAVSYRIFKVYPLPDILAMDKGIIDAERDGDQVLFDFLVAVFDDPDLVSKYYDSMNTEDIERIVSIYCRINHIDDKEEAAKNRAAKETNH